MSKPPNPLTPHRRSDIFPEKEEEKDDGKPDDIDRIDVGNFIVNQARKKAQNLELDRMTENLILLSNALRNLFMDDAQEIIRDEGKSFRRDNFDEAILFLFLTVYYKQETSYDTIMSVMENCFRGHGELERFTDGDFYYRALTSPISDERKEFDKYCLLKASVLSCPFIINLIVEKADLTNICITEIILCSIVEKDMFEAIGRILDVRVNISVGIIKERKKYRNTYDPENLDFDYIEKDDGNKSFYYSENQKLALLKANYVKSNFNDDSPTKLKIKEIDVIREMVFQNKKAEHIIGIISRIKDKNEIDSTFILFALKRKFILINYIMNKRKDWKFEYPLFIMWLENDCHDIAVILYKNFESYFCESKIRINIVPHILNSFSKGTNLIEAKWFLLKKYIGFFTLNHCKRLLDIYEYKLLTHARSNALVNNPNPVKTSCLLIEIIDLIDFYSLKIQKQAIKQKLIDNLLKVVDQVDSIAEMRHLFFDQDLELRDSLTFIWDNQIDGVLKNAYIWQIVDELWNSSYNIDGFIWNASSSHQMLFNYDHCRFDYEYKSRFYRSVKLKKIHAHPLCFEVWKNSGKSRYYIDTVVTIIFGIVLHFMIQNILELTYRFEGYEDVGLKPSIDEQTQLWNLNLSLAGISFMYMMFSIQIILNAIYSSVNNNVMRLKSYGYFIDGFLFIFFLTFVFITYAYNRNGTWSYQQTELEIRPNYTIFYDNYRDNGRREDIILIVIGITFWMKVFYSLRLLPLIGPLMAILKVMIRPIVNYLIFIFVEISIFAAVAHLLFQSISNYRNWYEAFKTLFPAAIGSFDFTDINSSQIGSSGGKVFLAVFLIVNNMIIIANFIGLLVIIYRNREKYSTIFYSYTTLSLRPVTLANPWNSCLISAPTPLNALHFLHMWVLLTLEDETAIAYNEVVLHIIYVPILFVQTILFFVWSLALAPFVYVKIFMHKMTISFTYSRTYREERNNKFLYWIAWILIGLPILAWNLIRDTIVFIFHCYNKDIDTTSHEVKADFYISNSILEQVAGILRNYIDEGNRIVVLATAVTDIRSQIKVDEALFVKVYGQPPKGVDPQGFIVKKYEEIIKAFNIIKTMLVNNSSRVENFDEIVRGLLDDPSLYEIKETSVDVIDCKTILSFISNILTIRILHKVIISDQKDIFSKPMEKRKGMLKELETLYGSYKIDKDLISDRVVKRLELYMTRSIAYCNSRRVYEALDFSPKNEKFLTFRSTKQFDDLEKERSNQISAEKARFEGIAPYV